MFSDHRALKSTIKHPVAMFREPVASGGSIIPFTGNSLILMRDLELNKLAQFDYEYPYGAQTFA